MVNLRSFLCWRRPAHHRVNFFFHVDAGVNQAQAGRIQRLLERGARVGGGVQVQLGNAKTTGDLQEVRLGDKARSKMRSP